MVRKENKIGKGHIYFRWKWIENFRLKERWKTPNIMMYLILIEVRNSNLPSFLCLKSLWEGDMYKSRAKQCLNITSNVGKQKIDETTSVLYPMLEKNYIRNEWFNM